MECTLMYVSFSARRCALQLVVRIALLFGAIKAGVVLYEFVVPEEHRLKYKYRHHGHESDHGGHH